MQDMKKAARAWVRAQGKLGRRAAMPVFLLLLLGTAAAIGQAWCIAGILGPALEGQSGPAWALPGFAALALLRAALQWGADALGFTAGATGRARLRAEIVGRLLAAGPAILRERHSGDLAATVTDQVEAMEGLYARYVPASLHMAAGPLLVMAALWTVDPHGAMMLLDLGLLTVAGQAVAGIGAAAASRGQFLALARLQARFLDRVRGIATIVLAGGAAREAQALAEAAADLRRRTMKVLRVAFLSSAVLDCATAAGLVAFALRYRAHLLGAHEGAALALFGLLLVPEFFAPLRGFAAAYQDQMHATGAAESLMTVPALPPAPPPSSAIRTIEARGVSIAFQDVRLVWDPARPPALDGLSFVLPAGEMLVLAGPSGAGKSSVIELLLGFARPTSGRITLNGIDITDIVPDALARLTAWIGQRPTLFAGTIRENIAFARDNASDAEIEEAARQARVTEFAATLPQGLDTRIGEGGHGISGGQAQRVAIARAFLKNAPLLLLDEPTSHLDPATEADVLASLRRLAVGRTVVMASHSAAAHAFGGRRLDLRDGRLATLRAPAQAAGA